MFCDLWAVRIPLKRSKKLFFVIGRTPVGMSDHEKSGWSFEAGTTLLRLRRALIGHKLSCGTSHTDWLSPGLAVFAEGRSRRT